MNPMNPETYDRLGEDRRLPVFGSHLCTSNPTPNPPAPNEHMSERLASEIQKFVFGIGTDNAGRAPPCEPQAPLGRLVGQPGQYPRLQPLPE